MTAKTMNITMRDLVLSAIILAFFFASALTARADSSILNVSYDISRELYKDINTGFAAARAASGGKAVTVRQSHGGSSRQALSVIAGLEADVVTMNQAPDIDILVERGSLVAKDWRTRFPHEASPYATVSVFLVRKGNPKGIRDWSDLVKPGMQVIVPNPKTSGNGRYTYLAAWGYAISRDADEAKARNFVEQLFANVPVLDGGGRGATTTFAQRDIGDVLVTFEAEATALESLRRPARTARGLWPPSVPPRGRAGQRIVRAHPGGVVQPATAYRRSSRRSGAGFGRRRR